MTDARPLWTPAPQRAADTQMARFQSRLSQQHGFDNDWPSLHRWSVENPGLFWSEMLAVAGVEPVTPASDTLTGSGMLETSWFPGMTLNYAAHLLRFDGDGQAIIAWDELGRRRSMTFGELRKSVAGVAQGLRNRGVGVGDRVAGFLPNIPEAVIAMLATASLGAIWSSCSPDFGLGGVLDRFGQIAPRVLFAADGYSYNGKRIDCSERIAGILNAIPDITQCVVVPFAPQPTRAAQLPQCTTWDAFVGSDEKVTCTPVPFDHPLFIMYSSGTTGVPKCIVHGHGGTLLQHAKEHMLHTDIARGDRVFYFTTCGWMMWNWLVSALGCGATLVLYDGSPFHPDGHHLWNMAASQGIRFFGTSPKFLSACQKAGIRPGAEHDLTRLDAILSTGSPLTAEHFQWVYREVREDIQLASICGGTDIISCFMLGNPMLPVYEGEIQCLGLGMDVQAWEGPDRPVIGRKGELVCVRPFPSQPVGFWDDPDKKRYREAYFEHFPGVWRHGDFVEITPRGGVIVFGRSDATLNPGGVRIGTAEIYRQVETVEEVVDSVVVPHRIEGGDVEVCLFVVLRDDLVLDQPLIERIKARIRERTTPRHVPKRVRQVTAVPYTISGKKVELAVAQMLHGEDVANRDALANPEALDQYANIL